MAKKPLHELLGGVTRFGKLVVLGEAPPATRANGASDRKAYCRCDCGVERSVYVMHLKAGRTRSCGCEIVRGKPTHGLFYHPLYGTWNLMNQRCHNPDHRDYPGYGARGIVVCERWRESPEAFIEDMGPRPEGHSLDRIDNDGGYEPGNCRWADSLTQARNRACVRMITYQGKRMSAAEGADLAGLPRNVVWKRLSKGWSVDRALSTPLMTPLAASQYGAVLARGRSTAKTRDVEYQGERLPLKEACRRAGVEARYKLIHARMQKGKTFAEALNA